jgi:hypothetical protein
MNVIVRLLSLYFIITSLGAAEPNDIYLHNSESIYKILKSKTDNGKKVRVIAWIKSDEKGLENLQNVSQRLIGARSTLEQAGAVTKRELSSLGALVLELDGYSLDSLMSSGLVERIQEDISEPPLLIQSIDLIGADLVHDIGYSGSGQAVVILDTGIETNHPFFSNRVVEEACFSSNDSEAESLCPNGRERQIGPGAAVDCSRTGISDCSHGTHVAGIAAGSNEDMRGVAPAANIVAVQVFSLFGASHEGCAGVPCVRSYRSDQYAALEWVLNESTTDNIAAVNISIGSKEEHTSSCDNDPRALRVYGLRSAGIATVIGSGNMGHEAGVAAPGCISYAITVGSTDDVTDRINNFSNSSALVDILAPGRSIYSSVLNGEYGNMSGTPMAAPHVTGAFAVMREINDTASVADIEHALEANGLPILDERNNLIFPRLDLYASVISFDGVPIASLDEEYYSVIVNSTAEFTANSSSDPNNRPLTYIWNFGDGLSGYQTSTPNVEHVYENVGVYNIELETSNGIKYSAQPDIASVTVYDPVLISILASSLYL